MPTATSPSTRTTTVSVFFGKTAEKMKNVGSKAAAQDWLEHEHPHDVAGKHIDVSFTKLRHKPQDVQETRNGTKKRTLTLYASLWVDVSQLETFKYSISELVERQRAITDAPLPVIHVDTGTGWQIVEHARLNL